MIFWYHITCGRRVKRGWDGIPVRRNGREADPSALGLTEFRRVSRGPSLLRLSERFALAGQHIFSEFCEVMMSRGMEELQPGPSPRFRGQVARRVK